MPQEERQSAQGICPTLGPWNGKEPLGENVCMTGGSEVPGLHGK